MCSNLKSNT